MNEFSWPILLEKAREIGFTDLRAVPVTADFPEGKALDAWLEKGYHADMEYMSRTAAVRKNIDLFLPHAKSVIVATVNYFTRQKKVEKSGTIARYAYGRDYHKVMKPMFEQLAELLRSDFFPDSKPEDYRTSIDAQPVMERAWAKRARLGFIGKNTMLITEQAGSWVLIGCLVTTQELKVESEELRVENPRIPESQKSKENTRLQTSDTKDENQDSKFQSSIFNLQSSIPDSMTRKRKDFASLGCGNCTRCIDKCPTKAIIQGENGKYSIDARRCIAYLTIENRGPIPLEFRDALGDRMFGCDICQEVCPYNARRENEQWNPFKNKPIAGSYQLLEKILTIKSEAEFLENYAGSPMMRAKYHGTLRNACVVAGNSGESSLVPILQNLLSWCDNDMVKEHAQWAINKLKV